MNKKPIWRDMALVICVLISLSCTGRADTGYAVSASDYYRPSEAWQTTAHYHGPDCGHYYWGGAWHDYPHPQRDHYTTPHYRDHRNHGQAPHYRDHRNHGQAPHYRDHRNHGQSPHHHDHRDHGQAPHRRVHGHHDRHGG